jgi:Tfp pilus assembly protein PilN
MIKVNLLRKDLKPSGGKFSFLKRDLMIPAVLVLFIVLILFGIYMKQKVTISRIGNDIRSRKVENNKLKAKIDLVEALTSKQKLIKERMRIVRELDRNRFTYAVLLDILSMNLPPKLWLSSITDKQNLVHVEGYALTNFMISDYIASL